MADPLEEFQKFRAEVNEEILGCGHLGMKRFFTLDHQTYEPGALDAKTKELLGLVASTALLCDDCITYHLVKGGGVDPDGGDRCAERGVGGGRFDHRAARASRLRENEGSSGTET